MGADLVFAFLAGALSALSPCILPLLPIVLGSAVQQHRHAPAALIGGVVISFTVIGSLVAALGLAIGLDSDVIRRGAAIIMFVAGIVLMVPVLQAHFTRLMAPAAGRADSYLTRLSGQGLGGQLLLGLVLGAAWSPCAGPSLGAAIGLATSAATFPHAMAVMALFGVGTALPMLVLAYGSRQALVNRRQTMAKLARYAKPVMGAALVALAVLILTGADHWLEARLTSLMPAWLLNLTTRY